MADAGHVPGWERELLEREAARKARAIALRTAEDVLCAYELGALGTIEGRYLADTLRIVLAAVNLPGSCPDDADAG